MVQEISSDQEIRNILSENRAATVGVSKDSSKTAHCIPKYFEGNGSDITPVNLTANEILGTNCFDSISEIKSHIGVDAFRHFDQILSVIVKAIKKRPKVIGLQEENHNIETENLAHQTIIKIIFNRRMLTEYQGFLSS